MTPDSSPTRSLTSSPRRYKHEARESLGLDQISCVLAPSALRQTDYPANIVALVSARGNRCAYYSSSAVR